MREHRLRSVSFDLPALMVVLSGTKRLHADGERWSCRAGDFALVHRPGFLDLENTPDLDSGLYQSWGMYFPWRVVELARSFGASNPPLPPGTGSISTGRIDDLAPAVTSLLDLAAAPGGASSIELDHRLVGVLLALARLGHARFLRAADPSISSQVRMLVSSDPAREWTSCDFELALHMSGATLRRRLAEEKTSLRLLIREARLHHGLMLLQSTRRPLKAIAFASGYRSLPSFSKNFLERFGVEPRAVMAT